MHPLRSIILGFGILVTFIMGLRLLLYIIRLENERCIFELLVLNPKQLKFCTELQSTKPYQRSPSDYWFSPRSKFYMGSRLSVSYAGHHHRAAGFHPKVNNTIIWGFGDLCFIQDPSLDYWFSPQSK